MIIINLSGGRRTEERVASVMNINPFKDRDVAERPDLVVPSYTTRLPIPAFLMAVQRCLLSLQYNHLSTTFFNLSKNRPLHKILETGREILKDQLPIRCLEAVFVSLHLTQPVQEVERIPVAFKTIFRGDGSVCRHIVLAVRYRRIFGALGLSRRATLMDKELRYARLSMLLDDYMAAYEDVHHDVVAIKVGLPVSHDSASNDVPVWRYLCLRMSQLKPGEWRVLCDNFSEMTHELSHCHLGPTTDAAAAEGGEGDSDDEAETRQRIDIIRRGVVPLAPAQQQPQKRTASVRPGRLGMIPMVPKRALSEKPVTKRE